jgi:hypothetical protein
MTITSAAHVQRLFLPLMFLSVFTGCVSYPVYLVAHQGPGLPPEERVLVKPVENLSVISVDGMRELAKGFETRAFFGFNELEAEMAPGHHTLSVWFDNGNVHAMTSIDIDFEGQAGHKYLLYYQRKKNGWKPLIADVTGKDELWCAGCLDKVLKDDAYTGPISTYKRPVHKTD